MNAKRMLIALLSLVIAWESSQAQTDNLGDEKRPTPIAPPNGGEQPHAPPLPPSTISAPVATSYAWSPWLVHTYKNCCAPSNGKCYFSEAVFRIGIPF